MSEINLISQEIIRLYKNTYDFIDVGGGVSNRPNSDTVFRHTIAKVLQPKSVIEIGVGSGWGLMAVAAGCKDRPKLVGIDDASLHYDSNSKAAMYLPTAIIHNYDTQKLKTLKPLQADFFIVDGDDSSTSVAHDLELALEVTDGFIFISSQSPAIEKFINKHNLPFGKLPTEQGAYLIQTKKENKNPTEYGKKGTKERAKFEKQETLNG